MKNILFTITLILVIIGTANAGFIVQPPKPPIAQVVSMEQNKISNWYNSTKKMVTDLFNDFWFNQYGYSPTEMAQAWGNNATSLFGLSFALQQILQSADPSYHMLMVDSEIYHITPSVDGTVTIIDTSIYGNN